MEQFLAVLSEVLSTFCVFFIFSAIIVFLHCFYDPAFQWGKKKAIALLVLICLESVPLPNPVLGTVLYFVFLLAELTVVFWGYKGKLFLGLVRFSWMAFVIIGCSSLITEICMQYIFPSFNTEMGVNLEQSLIVDAATLVFFAAIFFYLYFRIYKQGIVLPWKNRERIFVLVYSLILFTLPVVMEDSGKRGDISLVIMGISFILMAVLLPVFFYYLRISEYFQKRAQHQEGYIQAELAHFQQYKQSQEETARFRHDIRNNLLCISDLLRQEKSREAAQYLKDMLETVESLSNPYVTGDALLDSIVGVKSQLMQQQGIRFSLDGVLAGGLSWKPMDICSVFANALDNAIEACRKLPEESRYISMQIRSTPQVWFVSIQNPVKEAVDTAKLFQRKGGYTSKANAAMHGLGTYNMKFTVESYGAVLNAECSGQTFTLEIMIPKTGL